MVLSDIIWGGDRAGVINEIKVHSNPVMQVILEKNILLGNEISNRFCRIYNSLCAHRKQAIAHFAASAAIHKAWPAGKILSDDPALGVLPGAPIEF